MKKITGFLLIAISISIALFNSCKKDAAKIASLISHRGMNEVADLLGSEFSLFGNWFNGENFLMGINGLTDLFFAT